MAPGVHPRLHVKRYLLLASLLLGSLQLSRAATLESMTIERMASEATAIVRGTVGDSRAGRFGALVYTLSRFEVAETLKGNPPRDLEVALPGGSLGGVTQRFSGVPRLVEGQEYLAFLWTGPSGRTQIVGFGQGLFEVHREGDAAEATRAPLEGAVVIELDSEAAAKNQRFELDSLRARIAAALATSQASERTVLQGGAER